MVYNAENACIKWNPELAQVFDEPEDAANDFSLDAAISSRSSDNVRTRFKIIPVHMPS